MPSASSYLPVLVAVVALVATMTVGPVPAAAGAEEPDAWPRRSLTVSRSQAVAAPPAPAYDAPLEVTIDSLTPSSVPTRGPVRVSGSVTNVSEDRWVAVNMHAFVSDEPIVTSAQLAAEVERDPADPVGERITRPGSFDNIESIEPGESVQYSTTFNSKLLDATEPGAYWFGVHAMGDDGTGRDIIADGRARTFLSLVPRRTRGDRAVDTALVVPIRHDIRHQPDGRLDEVSRWARTLSPGGSLRSLVDFGASAGDEPVTWLLDPAVPDAVQSLVDGNPPRSLADSTLPPVEGESPSPEPSPTEESPAPTEEPAPRPNVATEPGETWLDRLRQAIEGDQVLALPFGDLDVSAAALRDPETYTQARERTRRGLQQLDVPRTPAVAAPDGFLDPAALEMITRRSTILVSDEMYAGDPPPRSRVDGRTLITLSSSTGAGGPGPDDPLAAVALRQRILGEAAVRALAGADPSLVVMLPERWRPESTTGFFSGLDVDWLDLTTLDAVSAGGSPRVEPERLTYPENQLRLGLDEANFDSASALIERGRTLEEVLLRNDEVSDDVADQALSGLSYAARSHPDSSRADLDRAARWIGAQLGSISVSAPPAVTLSSSSGEFSATVTNQLEHPVRVRLEAVTGSELTIEGPPAIDVPAGGRASIPLRATTGRLGVTNVELQVTTENGMPLGSTDSLPIRPSNVSSVIWVILGAGAALLFGAILVRLVRRLLRARPAARA